MFLWDWSHDNSPQSHNHILPFTYSYYTAVWIWLFCQQIPYILEMDEYDMFGNMENANRLNIIHIKLIKRAKKKKKIYILNTEFSSARRQQGNWSLTSTRWESRLKRELSSKTGRGMTFITYSLNLKAINLVGRNPLATAHQPLPGTRGFPSCSEEIHIDQDKELLIH